MRDLVGWVVHWYGRGKVTVTPPPIGTVTLQGDITAVGLRGDITAPILLGNVTIATLLGSTDTEYSLQAQVFSELLLSGQIGVGETLQGSITTTSLTGQVGSVKTLQGDISVTGLRGEVEGSKTLSGETGAVINLQGSI